MSVVDSPTSPPNAAPSAVTGDAVPCPMCEYDLRGLTEARCPECGYAFDWRDLLDRTRRKHKYLFEHHPDRNIWSFLRTATGGLLPWRFWRSLRPDQPSNARRLIVYWLLTVWGPFVVPVGFFTLTALIHHINNVPTRARVAAWAQSNPTQAGYSIQAYGTLEAYLDSLAPVAPSREFFAQVWRSMDADGFALIATPCVAWLLLPWLLALSLMVFQATMRRSRVRGAHALRCCLYSFDTGLWLGLLGVTYLAATWIQIAHNPNGVPRIAMASPLVIGIAAAVLAPLALVKLLLAYRLYMRFPHAMTTVFLALFVTCLALLIAAANVPGLDWRLYEVWNALRLR